MIMNMPVSQGGENLVWNISDDIKIRLGENITTLPLYDIGTKVNTVMIKHNDVIHLIGYSNSSSACRHYRYKDGTWGYTPLSDSSNNVFIQKSSNYYADSRIFVYKDELYATGYAVNNNKLTLYKFNYTTDNWVSVCDIYSAACTAAPFIIDDTLYFLVGTGAYIYVSTFDDKNLTCTTKQLTYSQNNSVIIKGCSVIFDDCSIIPVQLKSDTNLNMIIFSPTTYTYLYTAGTQFPCGKKLKSMVYTGAAQNHKAINKMGVEQIIAEGAKYLVYNICENGDGRYILSCYDPSGPTSTLYYGEFYKEATTYAPKGTKIRLSNDMIALSDNLQVNGDIATVTADGEVKIGIYE